VCAVDKPGRRPSGRRSRFGSQTAKDERTTSQSVFQEFALLTLRFLSCRIFGSLESAILCRRGYRTARETRGTAAGSDESSAIACDDERSIEGPSGTPSEGESGLSRSFHLIDRTLRRATRSCQSGFASRSNNSPDLQSRVRQQTELRRSLKKLTHDRFTPRESETGVEVVRLPKMRSACEWMNPSCDKNTLLDPEDECRVDYAFSRPRRAGKLPTWPGFLVTRCVVGVDGAHPCLGMTDGGDAELPMGHIATPTMGNVLSAS
jgi:hypothetical protein